MTAALPAAQPPKPPQTPKQKPKKPKSSNGQPNPTSGKSGDKKPKAKGKKSKQNKQTKRPKSDQQQSSQGNQSKRRSQQAQQPPQPEPEIYYDYDQLNEAAKEFAKTLAYELGQHTRAKADEAATKAVAEVKKQSDGTWILNCIFWVFITLIGASSGITAKLSLLNMVPSVPGFGMFMSATGAAGQVDVSQLDMSPAIAGMTVNGFQITSGYGPRTAPTAGASSNHDGVDVANGAVGGVLHAPAAGQVNCAGSPNAKYSKTTNTGGYGAYGLEFISSDPGVPDFSIGHNASCLSGAVAAGQKIGTIGNEGVSTGPHAHIVQYDANGSPTQPQIGFINLIMGAPVPLIKGGAGSTSGDLVSLVKGFESCHETAYWDYAQYSIGYGTKGSPSERVSCGPGGDAEQRLLSELDKARSQVQSVVKVPLNQHELDALTTFQYNTGAIQGSDILRQLNAGNKQAAANEFDRWVYANGQRLGGLVDRRREEKELFLTGDYVRQ